MAESRLIYLDFGDSRGEKCYVALHLAGVDVTVERVQHDAWDAMT